MRNCQSVNNVGGVEQSLERAPRRRTLRNQLAVQRLSHGPTPADVLRSAVLGLACTRSER
jgi:hypothetical protein